MNIKLYFQLKLSIKIAFITSCKVTKWVYTVYKKKQQCNDDNKNQIRYSHKKSNQGELLINVFLMFCRLWFCDAFSTCTSDCCRCCWSHLHSNRRWSWHLHEVASDVTSCQRPTGVGNDCQDIAQVHTQITREAHFFRWICWKIKSKWKF